jgi:hypothetical protein
MYPDVENPERRALLTIGLCGSILVGVGAYYYAYNQAGEFLQKHFSKDMHITRDRLSLIKIDDREVREYYHNSGDLEVRERELGQSTNYQPHAQTGIYLKSGVQAWGPIPYMYGAWSQRNWVKQEPATPIEPGNSQKVSLSSLLPKLPVSRESHSFLPMPLVYPVESTQVRTRDSSRFYMNSLLLEAYYNTAPNIPNKRTFVSTDESNSARSKSEASMSRFVLRNCRELHLDQQNGKQIISINDEIPPQDVRSFDLGRRTPEGTLLGFIVQQIPIQFVPVSK